MIKRAIARTPVGVGPTPTPTPVVVPRGSESAVRSKDSMRTGSFVQGSNAYRAPPRAPRRPASDAGSRNRPESTRGNAPPPPPPRTEFVSVWIDSAIGVFCCPCRLGSVSSSLAAGAPVGDATRFSREQRLGQGRRAVPEASARRIFVSGDRSRRALRDGHEAASRRRGGVRGGRLAIGLPPLVRDEQNARPHGRVRSGRVSGARPGGLAGEPAVAVHVSEHPTIGRDARGTRGRPARARGAGRV